MKTPLLIPVMTILLCILFVIMVLITGETKPTDVETLSDLTEKDTLHFTSSWAGYDTNAGPLKDVLTTYINENSAIDLVDESMAGEDFLFTLKTDFATGNDPDVFGLWPGSDFDLLVEQGRVADLTQVLRDDPDWYQQFREESWKYVTVDDKIYGLPFEIIYEGLFINIDIFNAHHVKIPTTYEELLSAVEAFKEAGIIPIAFNTTPEGSFIYQNMVMKLGGREAVESPFDDQGKLNQSFIDGLVYLKELYDMGAFPREAFYMDDKDRNDLFMDKKAAMIVQGSWFIGEQGVDPTDTSIKVVPFPSMPGSRVAYDAMIYGCGNGIFHMSQKAWEDPVTREYSLKLLRTLTSETSALRFQSSGGFISNIDLPEETQEQTYLYTEGEALINGASQLIGPTDSFIDRVIWEDIIVDQFEALLRGQVSAEAIGREAERVGANP